MDIQETFCTTKINLNKEKHVEYENLFLEKKCCVTVKPALTKIVRYAYFEGCILKIFYFLTLSRTLDRKVYQSITWHKDHPVNAPSWVSILFFLSPHWLSSSSGTIDNIQFVIPYVLIHICSRKVSFLSWLIYLSTKH